MRCTSIKQDDEDSVVLHRPYSRRLEVIVLTAPGRPYKGPHGGGNDQEREGKDQKNYAHREGSSNVTPRQATSSTVRELAGIIIAATSGLIRPNIASPTPTRL